MQGAFTCVTQTAPSAGTSGAIDMNVSGVKRQIKCAIKGETQTQGKANVYAAETVVEMQS